MDISNSLYYTFSTIAQVLAAFIALSGVFVIFKIKELKKMQFVQVKFFLNFMNAVSDLIFSKFHDCPVIAVNLQTLYNSECIGGMEHEMNQILKDPKIQKSHELNSLKKMKCVIDKINMIRLRIIFLTKISMISGLLTIIFSLIVLKGVPYISNRISDVLYYFGLFGFIVSISSMTWVIFVCLKERNYLTNDKPRI